MESGIKNTETDIRNPLNLDEERLEGYAAGELADRGPKDLSGIGIGI